MNVNRLFREDVLLSQRNRNYGSVSINMPPQYRRLTLGFSLMMVCVLLFLWRGEFSEKYMVRGYLETMSGVTRIYPKKNGVVARSYIKQGDRVKKGEPLFLIDLLYQGLDLKEKNNALVYLKKRRALIASEIENKKGHLRDLEQLLLRKYISLLSYQEKKDELSTLEGEIMRIDMEIIHYKNEKSYEIRSPMDGIVSTIFYQEGQYTHVSKPIIKLLPLDSNLKVELFIPVKYSGFLHRSYPVIIRFDAYPYLHFGTSQARISQMSNSILRDEEEDKPISVGEPYYKVTALLDSQFIRVYGQDKRLKQGMTISAVIVGSKRRIWQWIFQPLLNFYENDPESHVS